MVHRLALTVGVVASMGILAIAVAGGGLLPTASAGQVDGALDGGVKTVIDEVYVAPQPALQPFAARDTASDDSSEHWSEADEHEGDEDESDAHDGDHESGEHHDSAFDDHEHD